MGGVRENGHEPLVDQRKESLHRLYVFLPVLSFLESKEGRREREKERERERCQAVQIMFLSLSPSLPPSLSLLVFL